MTSHPVALITGGASGMGLEMANRLAKGGTRVVIVDRDEAALAAAARNPALTGMACDVADPAALQALADKVERDLGPVERLAAAAGIMPAQAIADTPVETFARVMRVNYEGIVNAVKAVLPGMLARKRGDIILFGSLAGVVPARHFGAYGASKAAINAFGEVLAAELQGSGVHALTVRPAAVNTPLINQAAALKGLQKQLNAGKMATPARIIDSVEAALTARKTIVYPTREARMAQWLRRLSPGLTWKLVDAANR